MTLNLPENVNIASWFVDQPAQKHPARAAILGEPVQVSYGELRELVNRAGNALLQMGCAPKDRVLIALPDSVEFIAAFFWSSEDWSDSGTGQSFGQGF